jgi:hypothetical protein
MGQNAQLRDQNRADFWPESESAKTGLLACTDGGAHLLGTRLQLGNNLLPFPPPASFQVYLFPIHRESYPHDSSQGIHELTFASGLC